MGYNDIFRNGCVIFIPSHQSENKNQVSNEKNLWDTRVFQIPNQ